MYTIPSRVLVDTGFSLNVLPKNSLIVRAFDGSQRSVIGEVDLPIKIGPYTFFVAFYIMDIYPTYSCLLGAVTSTLHRKLKFIVNGKLITIDGEEDILVNQLSSFRYIEVGGEIHKTPFQAFKIVNMIMAPLRSEGSKKSEFLMSSLKDAKTLVKAGHPEG